MGLLGGLLNAASEFAKNTAEYYESEQKKNALMDASAVPVAEIHKRLKNAGLSLVPENEVEEWRYNCITGNKEYFEENTDYKYYIDEYGMNPIMYQVLGKEIWHFNTSYNYANKNIWGHREGDIRLISRNRYYEESYHNLNIKYGEKFKRLQISYLRNLAEEDPQFKKVYLEIREKDICTELMRKEGILRIKARTQAELLEKDEFENDKEYEERKRNYYANFLEENDAITTDADYIYEVKEVARKRAEDDYNAFMKTEKTKLSLLDEKKLTLLHMYIAPPIAWKFKRYDANEEKIYFMESEAISFSPFGYSINREIAREIKNNPKNVCWNYKYYSTDYDPLKFRIEIEIVVPDDNTIVPNKKASIVIEKNIFIDDQVVLYNKLSKMSLFEAIIEWQYYLENPQPYDYDIYHRNITDRLKGASRKELEQYYNNKEIMFKIRNIIENCINGKM
ncbi:MAG: hypothetical protein IKO10_06085 [Lachnospiraceae bacterium]|nr:hypothetical protein [Lachnospiraceae bacterium]